MFRKLVSFTACYALGLLLTLVLLVGLMFLGQFDLIKWLQLTGQPVALLGLAVLLGAFWDNLSGTVKLRRTRICSPF